MTVCKFFRQGSCRFGDKCRFEHPSGLSAGQPHQGENRPQNQHQSSASNRFSPLQHSSNAYPSSGNQYPSGRNQYASSGNQHPSGGNRHSSSENQYSSGNNQYSSNSQRNQTGRGQPTRDSRDLRNSRDHRDTRLPYGLTRESIEDDMRIERPQWIMSSYGPGKDAPVQLFGGYPLEQSFEEVRVQQYLAMASGIPPQQSAQVEQEMAKQANQQVQNVLSDLDGAINYIVNGANTHPNRIDLVAEASRNAQSIGVFARSNARQFHPGLSGIQNNRPQPGFGGPAFSQPQNTMPGFGQLPALLQNASALGFSGFGTPNPPSGFGSTAQQQVPGSFGLQAQQPVAASFSSNSNGFSQPQLLTLPNDNTFGNASFAAQNGAFGVPQLQQPLSSGFGQAPILQQTGIVPFGGTPQINGTTFVQPSTSITNGGSSAPPGQQQTSSTYGHPTPKASNAFGTAPAVTPVVNGFQPHNQNPYTNAFQNQNQNSTANGFQPNGQAPHNADVSTYSTHDANNKLLTWKGQPVSYLNNTPCFRNGDGSWERIWFPDGPPALSQTQVQEAVFAPAVQEAYKYLRQNGTFQGGVMPEVAPSVQMCRWDI